MKVKKKIAGIMAALTVLTLGTTPVLADYYWDSPAAGDYRNFSERIDDDMTYVASSADDKNPWVEITSNKTNRTLDELVTTALNFKSTKNSNKATAVRNFSWDEDISEFNLSKANMSTLVDRKGYVKIYNSHDLVKKIVKFNATEAKALSFSVSDKSNDKAIEKIKSSGYSKAIGHVYIGGSGKLPGYISELEYVNFNIDEDEYFEDGYLYYYNEAEDRFEYVGTAGGSSREFYTIDAKITNTGYYVAVADKLPQSVTESIANDENKKVAESIKNSITAAKKGDTVKVDNLKEGVKIEKSVFAEAKDKGVALSIESPKLNAIFKFADFGKVAEMSGDFDPTVTIGNNIVPEIDKVMESGKNSKVSYVTVSFAYDGKLPGKTDVTLDVSNNGFKEGQKLYLYYFNEKTNLFEFVDESKYESGKVVFEMEHCSDYIIADKELAGVSRTGSPKTGDISVVPYTIVLLAGVALIVGILIVRKRRA